MTIKHFSRADVDALPQRYRANLINSLSGFKSANLIGTADGAGQTNLAIVSSVVHLGANPPLLGMIMRPHTVRRDTIENIHSTGFFTINHVTVNNVAKAHQTSARYEQTVSEFDAVGLNEVYRDDFSSPYVQESPIQLGMQFVESVPITHNDTSMIIGEILHIYLSDSLLNSEGLVDLNAAEVACISGLDSYHQPVKVARFNYAKPELSVSEVRV